MVGLGFPIGLMLNEMRRNPWGRTQSLTSGGDVWVPGREGSSRLLPGAPCQASLQPRASGCAHCCPLQVNLGNGVLRGAGNKHRLGTLGTADG